HGRRPPGRRPGVRACRRRLLPRRPPGADDGSPAAHAPARAGARRRLGAGGAARPRLDRRSGGARGRRYADTTPKPPEHRAFALPRPTCVRCGRAPRRHASARGARPGPRVRPAVRNRKVRHSIRASEPGDTMLAFWIAPLLAAAALATEAPAPG